MNRDECRCNSRPHSPRKETSDPEKAEKRRVGRLGRELQCSQLTRTRVETAGINSLAGTLSIGADKKNLRVGSGLIPSSGLPEKRSH